MMPSTTVEFNNLRSCDYRVSGKDRDSIIKAHRSVSEFLSVHDYSDCQEGVGDSVSRYVFVYWNKGYQESPDIVKRCFYSTQMRNQDRTVIFLDDKNIKDYIDLPDCIFKSKNISPAHYSDIIRVSLLKKYGGAWLDATCFSATSITQIDRQVFSRLSRERYIRSNFFAYTSGNFLSNWFLISSSKNLIPTMLSDYLIWYWKNNESIEHYFWFHLVFRAMYYQNIQFRSK